MPSPQEIAGLIFKYLRNEISEEEKLALDDWRGALPENEQKFQKLTDPESLRSVMNDFYSTKERAWNILLDKAPELKPVVRGVKTNLWRALIAAAVIAAISAIGFFLFSRETKPTVTATQNKTIPADIPAGTNVAILTLANGSNITLGNLSDVSRAKSSGNNIENIDSSGIAYASSAAGKTASFNTLTTPRAVTKPKAFLNWMIVDEEFQTASSTNHLGARIRSLFCINNCSYKWDFYSS